MEKNEDLAVIGECGKYYYVRMDGDRATGFVDKTKIEIPVINSLDIELAPTKKRRILAGVYPAIATNKRVKWKVDDKRKATISSSGILTAISEGTIKIGAYAGNQSDVKKAEITASKGNSWR